MNLKFHPATGSKLYRQTEEDNTVFASMSNIGSVSFGLTRARNKPKSLITTDQVEPKVMIRVPTNRPPTHPGEMLVEEFLTPMGINESELAEYIHVPAQRINEIITDQKSVTPSIALRLARYFGMSPDFWMNLQLRWDLYHTQQAESEDLNAIRPHVAA